LREVSPEIAIPLTHLYNASLLNGIFPSDWKCSHIMPVYKGGPIEDPMMPVFANILVNKILFCRPLDEDGTVNATLGRANLNRDNLFYALPYSKFTNIIDPCNFLLIEDHAESIMYNYCHELDRNNFNCCECYVYGETLGILPRC